MITIQAPLLPTDVTPVNVGRWQTHVSATGNPHGATPADVGADPAGAASSAITAHLAAFVHGDIAHSNRAHLDAIDQPLATTSTPALAGLTVDGGTLCVDRTSHHVGIGRVDPAALLDILGTGTSIRAISTSATGASTGGALITLYADDGAPMASGDRIGTIMFGGAKDSSHGLIAGTATITAYADEAWSDTAAGTRLVFATMTPTTQSRVNRMTIRGDGTVGVGVDVPSGQLHSKTASASRVALIAQGISGQTADLMQCQDSTGAVKAYIDPSGVIGMGPATVDGSWRLYVSGSNLLIQRRESGSWVSKQTL